MKKLMFIMILLVPSLALKAQDIPGVNQYSDGFSKGYKKGYCFGTDPGTCIAPIPPIPPVPTNLESPDSYQDGYNEGFSHGLADQKKDVSNNGQRYQTNSPESVDFIYKLDVGSILEVAAAQRHLKGIAFEYYNNKDFNTCIALCSRLLPSDPHDPELFMIIGECYYSQMDYKKALDNLRKAQYYDRTNTLVNIDKRILMIENEYNKTKN